MIAISARGLSKRYVLYERPADRLKELLARGRRAYHQDFWALHDVSFDIPRGQTVGVIGRNGSGKSTLLQLLAGTVQPTTGSLEIHGRISALLELGAGFNPEFTGRENAMLNGAIMGFSDQEMKARIPAVEEFADIGPFFDLPVRTFSSGMFVRLAFATAINVAPDVLLIDEALAVGDAVFQYRCLRKIRELKASGITIFFVSHDLSAVKNLCDHALLLEGGRLLGQGDPYQMINQYQALVMAGEVEAAAEIGPIAGNAGVVPPRPTHLDEPLRGTFRHGNGAGSIAAVAVLDLAGAPIEVVTTGEPFKVAVRIKFDEPVERPVVGIMVRNRLGMDLYGTNTELQGLDLPPGQNDAEATVEFRLTCWLGAGDYSITVALHTSAGLSCDWIDDAILFKVLGVPSAIGLANLQASVRLIAQSPDVATVRGGSDV